MVGNLKDLINQSKTMDLGKGGLISFEGILRKSSTPDTCILEQDQDNIFLEINIQDIVKHEVLHEISENEKRVRVYVSPDAIMKSFSVSTARLAKTVSSGMSYIKIFKFPLPVLPAPFILATPHLSSNWFAHQQSDSQNI